MTEAVTELIIDLDPLVAAQKRVEVGFDHLGDRGAAAMRKVQAAIADQAGAYMPVQSQIDRTAVALDRMRERYDPLLAAQSRYSREMTRDMALINDAVRFNLMTEQQAAAEIAVLRQRQIDGLDRVRAAQMRLNDPLLAPSNDNAMRGFNATNAAFQMQDVAMMAALGQSPIATALQQGPQLAMIMQQGGGLAALASGVASLVSPLMLATLGLTAASAAAIQWGTSLLDSSSRSEKALQRHKGLINDIARSYPAAGQAAKSYMDAAERLPTSVLQADVVKQQTENLAAYRSALDPIIRDLRVAGASGSTYGANAGYFDKVADALQNGRLQASDLVDILGKIRVQDGPVNNAKRFADHLQAAANEAARLQGNVDALSAADAVFRGGPLGARYEAGQRQGQWDSVNREALREAQRRHAAELQALKARSPMELAAAARAREEAEPVDPDESAVVRRYRIETAGAMELARAELEVTTARKQRLEAMDSSIAAQRLEIAIIGATTSAVSSATYVHPGLAAIEHAEEISA